MKTKYINRYVESHLGEIIQKQGLMKKYVAEKIGATKAQLNNWCSNENGIAKSTPNVLYVIRLERILGVKAGEMFKEIKED